MTVAGVERGVADGRLVDINDFVDVFDAVKAVEFTDWTTGFV